MLKKLSLHSAMVSALGLLLWSNSYAIPPVHQLDELPKLEPEAQHGTVSQRVTSYFTRYHFTNAELNNEMSEQILARYLEMLDYSKIFLLQSDIDQTVEYRHLFDDMINSGKLKPAYAIHDKVLQRRFERYVYALSLLDVEKPFDFELADDKYYYDREDAPWATSVEELNEIWRQRVKYDALNLTMTGKSWEEVVETLGKRYNNVLKRLTQTNSEDVFQTIMNSFARSVEAHTSYLSPANAERFEQNMNLSLEGIGAVLQAEYDYTVIQSLVPGGPADKSGALGPDDKIVAVGQGDDAKAEFVDVVGWRLDDVVELIKGPKGTTVRLQVIKANQGAGSAPREVAIVRDKVKLEDRAAKAEVKTPEEGDYAGRKMGVITIPGFYNNLTSDVVALIDQMTTEQVEGLIIDLRGNGGGSLSEAITLTGLFIDQGPVVQVAQSGGRKEINSDRDGQTYYKGPVVVMVDRYSASASEIFAAALQDYGRAVIVGENTYGKGTVQQHRGLARRFDFFEKPIGSVQYTIAKFYRINGGSTQLRGVTPDILYPAYTDAEEFGESSQENALPWDQLERAPYKEVGVFSDAKLTEWQQKFDSRVPKNPEFVYILEDIETYQANKDKTWLSLVLSERKAEEEEDNERKLQRANERLQRLGLKPVKDLEALTDEVTGQLPEYDPYLEETVKLGFDIIEANKIAMN
ncbi:carboxy terminal-processing peptidase [Pseudidiomarina mangrovi]|uniref:carboxy terminal-processing peptidase n=1 Tax=Pseudidiomarina mangrovi TaxID=2487133 RepID=UPI00196A7BDF|nr:carboxy terminal-processing peptidase [Pseudidiomarina mangrovi]